MIIKVKLKNNCLIVLLPNVIILITHIKTSLLFIAMDANHAIIDPGAYLLSFYNKTRLLDLRSII